MPVASPNHVLKAIRAGGRQIVWLMLRQQAEKIVTDYLWTSFIANNSSDAVLTCCSNNGDHWTNNTEINQASKFAPSLSAFQDRLYVACVGPTDLAGASAPSGPAILATVDTEENDGGTPPLARGGIRRLWPGPPTQMKYFLTGTPAP